MADASGPPETAQEIAAEAQEKVRETAGQAQDMLREQIGQRSSQMGEKVSGTAGDLRSVGEELRNQGKDGPAKLADRAADRAERLGSYLSEADPDRLLADVEDFGRRRPLAVLAGGVVVGMAAARFLKASSRDRYQVRRRQPQSREIATPTPAATPATPPPDAELPADPALSR